MKKELIILIVILLVLGIAFVIFKVQDINPSFSGLLGEKPGEFLEVRVEIPEEYLIVKPGEALLKKSSGKS